MTSKQQIRDLVKSRIDKLSLSEKEQRQQKICSEILKLIHSRGFRTIALYAALKDEVDILTPLLEVDGIDILLPSVDNKTMHFKKYNGTLIKGAYNIPEATGEIYPPKKIDAIFCPGRAFTPDGTRLGRGKGFYDRYLENTAPSVTLVGVCFREQIFDNLPSEEWDKKMDEIISE